MHRQRHRWRRAQPEKVDGARPPFPVRDRQVTAADIEHLMAATDATVERVMANVARITKPGAANA